MQLSPNDTNQYRYFTLSNHLRVLVVHDAQAQKSAAALAVNVGHFDDPAERQGLAHYLEHMLFLGTEKYPEVGDFQRYINQHGGSNNAWTGTEHTCFFFDIAPDRFEQGLDRFAQFFVAPLFNPEALDKERHAVDSEYKLKLNDDTRRIYQVQKETINPAHPFSKFSVGNLDTLGDRDGHSIRQEIVDFHAQHYGAELMTLTLVGPQSLDDLRQWAEAKFSAIAQRTPSPAMSHSSSLSHRSFPNKVVDVPYVLESQRKVWITIEPLKEMRKLTLTFLFPNMESYYRTKPLSYFAHLLGDESAGSLMHSLKEAGWIYALSAGGGASGSNYREFNVSCSLTEAGLAHRETIIESVFAYIHQIKQSGFAEWRYREKQAVLESAFRFQEPAQPLALASHLVINMQRYAAEDVVYGDYMMQSYEEEQLHELAAYLTPDNLRVTLVAKGETYDRQAAWYFTPYSVTPLSNDQLQRYRSAHSSLPLTLPEPNPFICYQLDPKPLEEEHPHPQKIEEQDGFRLWHLQEPRFRVPKGVVYIAIDSPTAVTTVRNIVMTRLCVEMFLDSLTADTYQAEIAGMRYNLYAHQGGVTLTLSGFSEKQPQLLQMILDRFARRDFHPERYQTIKQQLLRHWGNAAQDRPISQLFNAMSGLLQPNNPPYTELVAALNTIEVDELPDFVDSILSNLHVEMFVYGDWRRTEALALGEALKNALRVQHQHYQEVQRPLVMLGENGTFQQEIACNQEDSAIVIYYQSKHTDPRSIALYTLANHLMSAAFFHEIRTKQQLGYMVGTGNMPLNSHPGIVLYVQSPHAAPAELLSAIDEFLNALYLVLLELNDYQWHSSKRGLWNQIAAPDTTLRVRAQRFWVAIGNQDDQFDQQERVLAELKALSRSDMIRFVVNELKPRTANRLIMHTQGKAHQAASTLIAGQEIGSIEALQLRPKKKELG